MTKKRPSLKDKDVFKRSRDLDTLFGSPAEAEENKPQTRVETPTVEVPPVFVATPSSTVVPSAKTTEPPTPAVKRTPARKNTTPTSNKKPADPLPPKSPVIVLPAPRIAETEDPSVFPPALEMPPTGVLTEDLPAGEIGETTAEVDAYDFPVAMATPPTGPLSENMPAGEMGPQTGEVDAHDFPVAMETSPLTEDLPAGEMGLQTGEVDAYDFPVAMETSPLTEDLPTGEMGLQTDEMDMLDFPVAMETPPTGTLTEDLPVNEAGPQTGSTNASGFLNFAPIPANEPVAPADTIPFEEDDDLDLLASALAENAAPVATQPVPLTTTAPVTTIPAKPLPPARPVPTTLPVSTSTAPAVTAGAPTSTSAYVSRETPLSFAGDDMPEDFFDFRAVAEGPKTVSFELPTNAEDLTPEERKERMRLLNDPRIREQFLQVYNAIDAQYEHILNNNVSVSPEITDWAHKLLAETRYIIMNYQIKYLAKAEWNIEQVRARLDRAEESARQADKWSRWITIWGMLWFIVFVYLIFKPDYLLGALTSSVALSSLLVPEIFLRSLFFGAIGGVAAVFYSLLRYVTRRTFDIEFVISYFVKPFMGMIVGTLVYLIVFVVMQFFNITPALLNTPTTATDQTKRLIFEVLSYFLSAAAGFKENLVFDLLNKVMKAIFRDADTSTEVEAPPAPVGPSDLH